MDSPESHKLPSGVLFQSAFKFAAIGMAIVAPSGRFLKVNQSLCTLTGYDEAELLKLRFQEITHPDDLDLDVENVGKLLRGETTIYCREKRYFRKGGSIVWVLLSVSLVRDEKEQPLFFISQIQDITVRKEAVEKLLAANAEIERLRRGLLKVCAWTKRIEIDGNWIPIDEFLSRHLHLQLTHGMSDEAVRLFGRGQPPP